MEKHVRARTDNAHVANNNIEELWCFIKVRDPEELAYCRNTFVVNGNLLYIGFVINVHSSELKAVKVDPHVAGSFLYKENRAFRCELNE